MDLLGFDEARARVLADLPAPGGERVDLAKAPGRVLAEDLVAPRAVPAFDYSAMDGYAVCTTDLAADTRELRVEGESRAGGDLPGPLPPGTACRIFTGARLPARADAVVMQEDVTRTDDRALLATAPRPGAHLRRAGEDLAAGQRVLERGTRLGPHHVGLLATLERTRVTVAWRPVVSIVSTGDELREPGAPDRPGSVVDSNGPGLSALVRACGGQPRLLPHVRDELPATTEALARALEGADVVLTVGGASVGDHDLVRAAMEAAGVAIDFWRVAIKPGKPLVVGRHGRTRVLGLPGNPASAMLTFLLFGAPLVRALQGDRAPLPPVVTVRLAEALERTPGRTEFYRAQLDERACPPVARLLANQASGAVTGFSWADALVIVPGEVARLAAGATLECMRLRDV